MKILIIEDEMLAAERLTELLKQLNKDFEILSILDTVNSAVKWFKKNPDPDLVFFDIQLADGLSFQIFDQVKVSCPIIFTTAYDEYAIQAFKTNSIAYLLKPINLNDLEDTFKKIEVLRSTFTNGQIAVDWDDVRKKLQKNPYKKRFIVKSGSHFYSIKTNDIQCFFSEHKMAWLQQFNGKKYALDLSLDDLELQLDPTQFFRINRKFILNLEVVNKVVAYSGSRLKLTLAHHEDEKIIVSRERVAEFKEWLDQ